MLKRGYNGTYNRMSKKHLERYVTEFTGRHNVRELDTINQMEFLAKGMVGMKNKGQTKKILRATHQECNQTDRRNARG